MWGINIMLVDKLRECNATFNTWDICNATVFKVHESSKDQVRESQQHLLNSIERHHKLIPLVSWLPYTEMIVEYDDCVDWYIQDGTKIYYAAILKKSINFAHRERQDVGIGEYMIFSMDDERKLNSDIEIVTLNQTFKFDLKVKIAMYAAYGGLVRFLDILSCKNIITEITSPHEKANKKRKKNGRLPLVSFYTLKIQSKISQSTSNSDGQTWSNRVHLCRGHMREYGEDRPLFGKYAGKFWIPPHARGDKRNGVIYKQYELEQ